AARRACHAPRARLCARAVATFARHVFAKRNFLLHAARRFLERDLEIVAQIVAIMSAAAPRAAAEHFFENSAAALLAENLAENIERIVKSAAHAAGSAWSGRARAAFERRRTVTIVSCAFFRITEHFVGVRDFLEHLLRLFVARIF